MLFENFFLQNQKMGLDGGTIANSSSVISAAQAQRSTKSNDDGGIQSDNEIAQLDHQRRWNHCALSGKKFTADQPICCDTHGNLFLKESVLEFLIAKKKGGVPETTAIANQFLSGKFEHLKTLKNDICNLKLTPATEKNANSIFSCALLKTAPPANSLGAPFYVRWKCGHIFSTSAVSDLLEDQKKNGGKDSSAKGKTLNTCPIVGCICPTEESVLVLLVPPKNNVSEGITTRRERE